MIRKLKMYLGENPKLISGFLAVCLVAVLSTEMFGQQPLGDLVSAGILESQGILQQAEKDALIRKSFKLYDVSFPDAISTLNRLFNVDIRYSDRNVPPELRITTTIRDQSVYSVLDVILRKTNLQYRKLNNETLLLVPRDSVIKWTGDSIMITVTGTVVDSSTKQALKGVSIQISGVPGTVLTNESGRFSISAKTHNAAKITARLVGYKVNTRSVPVQFDGKANLQITLSPSTTTLGEVVTTATGQQRRVEVANDIVKIIPDEIAARSPVRTIADILEASQVPGVQVQRSSGDPGAPTRIRIRGVRSISQTNDPVIILDGIWVDGATGKPSKLDDIEPSSIESIEIIRGPSAATLYGQDAANGVIVINTKKGRPGVSRWDVSYNRDWGQTYGTLPLTYFGIGYDPTTRMRMQCDVARVIAFGCIQEFASVGDPNNPMLGREGTETNNKYVARLDGGSNAVRYAISASMMNTIGVRRNSPVEMARFRRVGYTFNDKFTRPSQLDRNDVTSTLSLTPREKLSVNITTIVGQTQLRDNSFDADWSVLNRGIPTQTRNNGELFSVDTLLNPNGYHTILAQENPTSTSKSILASQLQYGPFSTPAFAATMLNMNLGAERSATEESLYRSETRCVGTSACFDTATKLSQRIERETRMEIYTARVSGSTMVNLGSIGRYLEIRPSLGGDFKQNKRKQLRLEKEFVPAGDRSINGGVLLPGSGHLLYENATAGWYANSTIGILRRVYFDVGVRQDIGSAITSSSNAAYPKIGGSWLVSDEGFWKDNDLITLFRIRSAFGHSAVQPDLQDIYGGFGAAYTIVDGKVARGVVMYSPGNSKLRSERATEVEVGFDADLLHDRVNLVATYARSESKNVLVSRQLPPSLTGFSYGSVKENIARVGNQSLELAATSRVLENKRALVIVNYSLTLAENRVKKLGDNLTNSQLRVGYPITGVSSNVLLGYSDINGDGMLSKDEVVFESRYVGSSQPRYTANYGASVTLLNRFTFDSRFAYQSQYVQSFNNNVFTYGSQDVTAPLEKQAEAFLGDGKPVKTISDLRWNSASVQYQLPTALLEKFKARSMSISLQGRNLKLWSNYVGRDPQVNSLLASSASSEARSDNGETPPMPRLFVLDFKIGF